MRALAKKATGAFGLALLSLVAWSGSSVAGAATTGNVSQGVAVTGETMAVASQTEAEKKDPSPTPKPTGKTKKTGIDQGKELPDTSVQNWFNTQAQPLAQSLVAYAPANLKPDEEAVAEVGKPVQVLSWSAQMLQGSYAPETAMVPIDMWVAPVTLQGTSLGVVVYTASPKNLYPLPLPAQAGKLAPAATTGSPEPTVSPRDNTAEAAATGTIEPQNSHLPVRTIPPGSSYALPGLAKALLPGLLGAQRPASPVYDPVVKAWFSLKEETLSPASNAARDRLGGEARLSQVQASIQSWWGTVTPTPTSEPKSNSTGRTIFTWIVVVAVVIVGATLLILMLTFRWQSRLEEAEEVLPLPDPELILVKDDAPTSAIPTLAATDHPEAH